jgi:hypothetical protein
LRRRGATRFNLDVPTPADIDGLSLEVLKALVIQLLGKVAEQERLIAALREEIARLKGLNGRPRIGPSGMENAHEPTPPPGKRGKRRRRGKIVPRVAIQDRVIKAQVRFKERGTREGARPGGNRRGARRSAQAIGRNHRHADRDAAEVAGQPQATVIHREKVSRNCNGLISLWFCFRLDYARSANAGRLPKATQSE